MIARSRAVLASRVHTPTVPAFLRSLRRFRHRARLYRRAGSHRHRGRPSVTAAPLCGLLDTSGTHGRLAECGLIWAAV